METIKSYIENLFRNYPDTPQAQKAKRELSGIMEDKYYELKAEGKSEHEAIGIVISEFGSMEELASELGMDCGKENGYGDFEPETKEKRLTLEQASDYLKVQSMFGVRIAIGVAMCILSPAVSCITEALAEAGFLPHAVSEILGASSLFGLVTVAVIIFIVNGIAHGKYGEYETMDIRMDSRTKLWVEEQAERYNPIFGAKIAAGVALCILSVVPVAVIDGIFRKGSLAWVSEMSAVSLFAFVAAGVYLFITAGVRRGAYNILLGKGKRAFNRSKKDKRISVISAIYWPVVTSVYLGWSIVTMNWGFTWVVWPIAGILFGGISAAVSLVSEG